MLDVEPKDEDWGFGPAAVAVGRDLAFVNPAGRTTSMRLKVKFALGD